MAHRLFGVCLLIVASPIVLAGLLAKFIEDGANPLFISQRVGLNGKPFALLKIRTMSVGSHTVGIDTTVAFDPRLTRVGEVMRRYKLDELPQLVNVILGHMRLVGPRPNVPREVAKYTEAELELLTVSPGITDFASVAFSDLADRLSGVEDANHGYEVGVRPYKTELGLIYVHHRSWALDAAVLALTLLNFIARRLTLSLLGVLVRRLGGSLEVQQVICEPGDR